MNNSNINYYIGMLNDVKDMLNERFNKNDFISYEYFKLLSDNTTGDEEIFEMLEGRIFWTEEGGRVSGIIEDIDLLISLYEEELRA